MSYYIKINPLPLQVVHSPLVHSHVVHPQVVHLQVVQYLVLGLMKRRFPIWRKDMSFLPPRTCRNMKQPVLEQNAKSSQLERLESSRSGYVEASLRISCIVETQNRPLVRCATNTHIWQIHAHIHIYPQIYTTHFHKELDVGWL
ncbi:hypothetical protein Vafri_5611 [Volvox africanus]|uniref:Uncharacterized protein n=1 Tax=Volvox africanus TaxID=51714 RepID=A0A8J4EV21_9CHLO|nr:hypothetical protein Vafri_5611 [Volvox africanus]